MGIGNAVVAAVLRSRLHRILSGSILLVRYRGRRTGREITTPTQYAALADGLVIVVGTPETKRWWRNFQGDGADLEVLLAGTWQPMRGRAVRGADAPGDVEPLLAAYLRRFPKARRALGEGTAAEQAARAVVVHCVPRGGDQR